MNPFISVIIPVYNGEKFLPGCLDALVSTSYRDYELIVVDDCSTDRSVEISREKGAQRLKDVAPVRARRRAQSWCSARAWRSAFLCRCGCRCKARHA